MIDIAAELPSGPVIDSTGSADERMVGGGVTLDGGWHGFAALIGTFEWLLGPLMPMSDKRSAGLCG
jgi:hypothetical protein